MLKVHVAVICFIILHEVWLQCMVWMKGPWIMQTLLQAFPQWGILLLLNYSRNSCYRLNIFINLS